jgi:uncharacterized small protein (DUF1192 family)
MDAGFSRRDEGRESLTAATNHHERLIDRLGQPVNDPRMDLDDFLPKTPGDPVVAVVKQDLDRLSVEELQERIIVLEAEILRTKAKIDSAVNHRAKAEGLFKR